MTDDKLDLLLEEVKSLSSTVESLQEEREFPWWHNPVLTTEQAQIYTGAGSKRTFHRWMQELGVYPCADGRWARRKIDGALERLSRQRFKSNRGRKKSA